MSMEIKFIGETETDVPKISWTDENTRLLIAEYKSCYDLLKKGQINKKKNLWIKVAQRLQEAGHNFTPEQTENRFKTLIRKYRKSNGYNNYSNRRDSFFPYKREFAELIIDGLNTNEKGSKDVFMESMDEDDDGMQSNDDDDLGQSSRGYKPRKARLKYTGPTYSKILEKKNENKTPVDVLQELKELIKKVEIRKQTRHEQTIKIALERNKILKRRNELMEQILIRSNHI